MTKLKLPRKIFQMQECLPRSKTRKGTRRKVQVQNHRHHHQALVLILRLTVMPPTLKTRNQWCERKKEKRTKIYKKYSKRQQEMFKITPLKPIVPVIVAKVIVIANISIVSINIAIFYITSTLMLFYPFRQLISAFYWAL